MPQHSEIISVKKHSENICATNDNKRQKSIVRLLMIRKHNMRQKSIVRLFMIRLHSVRQKKHNETIYD